MASGRKSLSDFHGLPWSTWSEYAATVISSDNENEEKEEERRRKNAEVMRLRSKDMDKFGLFPETDSFCTVLCNECGIIVKPQGLLGHMRVRHRELTWSTNSPLTTPEKMINRLIVTENAPVKCGNDNSAKFMLNEKLMCKLGLNETIGSKNDKMNSSLSDKYSRTNHDKLGGKYSNSEKGYGKSLDKLSSKVSDKKLSEFKVKAGERINCVVVNESDKQSDIYSKSEGGDKSTKSIDKMKPVSDKHLSKFGGPESKFILGKSLIPNDKVLGRTGEKVSVKSVLSEKLLSKVASNEKMISPTDKKLEVVRSENLAKNDKTMVKPAMKSVLKDKVLKGDGVQHMLPGSSLLRPVVRLEKDLVLPAGITGPLTTLSPPILTPQNRTPEHQQSTLDMPVLSRKRKYRERKTPTLYDPDKHCGVWCDYFNKFCVRSLTCKVHSVALRRAVADRSKPFDTLLLEHRRAKEDQRFGKDEQDETPETSPSFSEQVTSPNEPSGSSFVSSPYVSPSSSPSESSAHSILHGRPVVTDDVPFEEPPTSLTTPSLNTCPPTPHPLYHYPPYPPISASPSLPDVAPSLSHHLSSPLLNVTLPGLNLNHAPRPPDWTGANGIAYGRHGKHIRLAARENSKLHLNKTHNFNIRHATSPPKPLRTCLFQGRKCSGMFLTQRQLEAMRSGFSMSVVKTGKNFQLSQVSQANQSPAHIPGEVTQSVSLLFQNATNGSDSTIMQNDANNSAIQQGKSLISSVCPNKSVINASDLQHRLPRTQKVTIPSQRSNVNSLQTAAASPVRFPITASSGSNAAGLVRVPVSLKAVLPKPLPSTNPVRYTLANRENGQFHVPNILTASRLRTEEPKLAPRTGSVAQTRINNITSPVTVAISKTHDTLSPQSMVSDTSTVSSEKMNQALRKSTSTSVPQQIAYLTATTPVTFQQVPLINPQVLSQLQLQKGAGGTLKLLSAGASRTLLVQPDQDGSGADS